MKFTEFMKEEVLTEQEVRFEALENMKNIQSQLGSISFIDVIAVMRDENPLKANIFEMEDMLHELTVTVSEFINTNLKDAVDTTADDQANKVDKAVQDAADEVEIDKKAPKIEEK